MARRMVVCKDCQLLKEYKSRGLCNACYNRHLKSGDVKLFQRIQREQRLIAVCTKCNNLSPIMAKGLCKKCYMRLWARRKSGGVSQREYFARIGREREERSFGACVTCGKEKKLQSLGKCKACYAKTVGRIVICSRCGKERKHEGLGLCASCYVGTVTSKRKTKKVICAICGKLKILKAKGLCQACYTKYHKKTWNKKLVICLGCKQEVKHEANGLCMKCYLQSVNGRKYNQARHAKKLGLPATLTNPEWVEILEKYNYTCAYCKEGNKPLHQEHWIPLSRGGGYTAENIVPACQRCNSRKHTMTGDEFLDMLKRESEWKTTSEF